MGRFTKSLFFVLIVLATGFTVSASYHNPLDYYFNADVGMTSGFTIAVTSGTVLSGDPNNMPNNGQVCPNAQITVTPAVAGTYTVSGISSPYPAGFGVSPPISCSNPGGATNGIYWLDDTTFDDQVNGALTSGYHYDPVYLDPLGGSGSFIDECVDYYDGANSYNNMQAGARVFGKGTITFKDGSTQFYSTSVSNTAASSPRALSTMGTHPISSAVSGVDSMPVVLKYPTSDNFRLYYYLYDAPSITPGSTTKNIIVQNRQNSITCGPTNPASPIAVPAGGGTIASATITNTGQVSNSVTTVSSSDSRVTAVPFNNLNCAQNGGSVPSTNDCCCANPPACDVVKTNGFNEAINPGGTKNVCIQLTAAASCTQGTSFTTNLDFTYSSAQGACNAAAGNPLTCTIGAVGINCGSGDKCEITDGPMPIFTGESRTFQLQCAHLTGSFGQCTGSSVAWLSTPPNFATITSSDTTQATLTFNHPGTGDLNATVAGEFNTTCSYSSTNNQSIIVQDVASCLITPPAANVGFKEVNSFILQCFDHSSLLISCGSSVNWALQGLSGIFFAQSGTGATVGIDSPVGSTGKLAAEIGNVSCASNLTVVAPFHNAIDLKPDSTQLDVNQTQPFTITCTSDGVSVPCTGTQWDPTGIIGSIGTLSNTTDTGGLFTATQDGNSLLCVLWNSPPVPPPAFDCSPIQVGQTGCTNPPCVGPGGDDPCRISWNGADGFTALCAPAYTPCNANWFQNGVPMNTGSVVIIPIYSPSLIVAKLGGGKECSLNVGPTPLMCIDLS